MTSGYLKSLQVFKIFLNVIPKCQRIVTFFILTRYTLILLIYLLACGNIAQRFELSKL